MANRRMFSKKITDTDEFLDMPASTQALYFHMNMHADDDGFVGNPKTIKRMVGASEDDLKLLIAKRYLICFQSGVVLITDWKVHNYIRKDTYTPTIYTDEMAQITQKQNGKYELMRACNEPVDGHVTGKYTKVLQGSNGLVDAGKDRLGKDNKVIYSAEKSKPNKKRQAKPDNLAPLRKKSLLILTKNYTQDTNPILLQPKGILMLGFTRMIISSRTSRKLSTTRLPTGVMTLRCPSICDRELCSARKWRGMLTKMLKLANLPLTQTAFSTMIPIQQPELM